MEGDIIKYHIISTLSLSVSWFFVLIIIFKLEISFILFNPLVGTNKTLDLIESDILFFFLLLSILAMPYSLKKCCVSSGERNETPLSLPNQLIPIGCTQYDWLGYK